MAAVGQIKSSTEATSLSQYIFDDVVVVRVAHPGQVLEPVSRLACNAVGLLTRVSSGTLWHAMSALS